MPAIRMKGPAPDWDSDAIFAAFGTPARLRKMLREGGWEVPDPHMTYTWKRRKHIPPRWALLCVYVLLQGGHAKLSELITIRPYTPPPKPEPRKIDPWRGRP
jgi:hypothetical protein